MLSFPLKFTRILAMRPCPCAHSGDPRRTCSHAVRAIGRYQKQ
jgi:predicted ATPase with chaperone activity